MSGIGNHIKDKGYMKNTEYLYISISNTGEFVATLISGARKWLVKMQYETPVKGSKG